MKSTLFLCLVLTDFLRAEPDLVPRPAFLQSEDDKPFTVGEATCITHSDAQAAGPASLLAEAL